MKKFKTLLSALALVLAIGMFAQTAYAAETATVNEVDDITDVTGLAPDVYQVEKGEYSNTAYFHLDKPGYVYISGYSDVCYGGNNLGTIAHFAVYSDETCINRVLGDKVADIWEFGKVEKYLCLDAGDYWIKFAKENSEDSAEWDAESEGQFALTVAAQYVDADGTKNTTKSKAQKIDTNKEVSGFLSSTTRNSWFAFDINTDNTIVNFGVSLVNAFIGDDTYIPDYTGVTVYDSKDNIVAKFNIESEYSTTVLTENLTFKKGTYYVKFSGDNAWDDWGDLYDLEVNNRGKVNLLVTAVEVPSISSCKNNAAGKVKVAYKKVTATEGYEIQYTTDADFSDGVKTKKVKAGKAKAAISKLKKGSTCYVRVRAWNYNVFDEKVYGNWSAVKSVKITK